MPDKVIAKYKSTQQELYSIADTIYDSLENPANLAAFEAKKPGKYTPAFILALRANKTAAFDKADSNQRSSIHETNEVELIALNATCCGNFRDLKGYIHDGFPKDLWKIKYDEAGMVIYESASHNNWENAVALNKNMDDFITTYPTELSTGFMPLVFTTKVTDDADAFKLKYDAFKISRETGAATAAKITADNKVYSDLQNLQNDAHIVFHDDSEMLKQFTILEVKKIVSPPGSADLGIDLLEDITNLPVANATVTIQSETGIAIVQTTSIEGIADFKSINPDIYKVKIQPVGKPIINLVKEVNTGVSARLKVFVPQG